jgi:plastocyanin
MKKAIIIIVILVIAGGGVYFYSKKEAKAPEANSYDSGSQNQQAQTSPQTTTPQTGTSGANYTPPQAPGGGENAGSNIQVYEVDYDGASYTPNNTNLKVGDYIFFKNKSSGDFWPVTGSADTLTAYPNFNPLNSIAAGGEYKFQFSKAGSFSFGDNIHPNSVFTVTVGQ